MGLVKLGGPYGYLLTASVEDNYRDRAPTSIKRIRAIPGSGLAPKHVDSP